MICRVGAVVRTGSALAIEQHVKAEQLLDAIRRERRPDRKTDTSERHARRVVVDCEETTVVHDHVGYIRPGMGIRTRTALAAAGRTRGLETPYDEDIKQTEDQLAALPVSGTDLEDRRQERANEREQLQKIREAVAATRGRLAACRERGLDTDDLEAQLQTQIQQLAEAETTATAARQTHEQAQQQARTERDRRERRFHLEDRLANRRRDARRWLVKTLEDEFTTAVEALAAVPVDEPFDCQPVVASLAIGRVAEYSAPLVLDTERFGSAAAAHDYLSGPVIRI